MLITIVHHSVKRAVWGFWRDTLITITGSWALYCQEDFCSIQYLKFFEVLFAYFPAPTQMFYLLSSGSKVGLTAFKGV